VVTLPNLENAIIFRDKARLSRGWLPFCLILCALLAFPLAVYAFEYHSDFTFVEVPDPLSGDNPAYPLVPRVVPGPAESFQDLRFGTALTRITEKLGLRHDYSRFDPFNADGSMMVLISPATSTWVVFRTSSVPYDQASNQVRTIEDLTELWWDASNPKLMWGLRDFSIIRLDVTTGRKKVIKDFSKDPIIGPIIQNEPDLYRITDKDEGEPSLNKRYWAVCLQGSKDDYRLRYILTWDRKLDRVLGLYRLSREEAEVIDWVGMSPLGRRVIIGGGSGKVKTSGLTMADKRFAAFHKLAYETAHSDVGLDGTGKEVIVMQNNRTDFVDLIPLDKRVKVVMTEADYENNLVKPIVRLYYNSESPLELKSGIHVSCNRTGYCVIGTYIGPGLPEQNWLDRSIILVKLDRMTPRAFYLAKLYNTTREYWEETHASMSNDGSKVVWADNWSRYVGREKCFVMLLNMPPGWADRIGSPRTQF